jgi:hypothetical protein
VRTEADDDGEDEGDNHGLPDGDSVADRNDDDFAEDFTQADGSAGEPQLRRRELLNAL